MRCVSQSTRTCPRPEAMEWTRNPTWWRRRTLMERYCTVLAAAAIFLCGVLTIALSVLYVRDTQAAEVMPSLTAALDGDEGTIKTTDESRATTAETNLCLTPGCVYTAAEVLKYMDKDVDPCDDFYGFVCGNYIKETIIPDDKTAMTLFSNIDDKLTDQLRIIIEEPSSEEEPKPFKMAKDLYKSCMNKTRIEEVGLTNIKALVKRMGGWPVLEGDSWDAATFNWKDTVYKFKDEGFSIDYLIDFSITNDYKNSTKRVIDLDQPSLSLSREYLVKGMEEKLVAALYSYMVDIAVMFGAEKKRATEELKEALNFEIKLANISLPPEERRDANKLYNPMTISELQKNFPSIPWLEYFSKLLPSTIEVQQDEVAIVDVPSYIKNLEVLLSNTPKRVQANYMLWRAVGSSISSLTEALRKRQLEYGTALSGRTEREPRWKECVGLSAGSLSLAAGSLYVKRYFKEEAKKNALEIVDNIREEMYKILKAVDWMDEETRGNALEKATSMTSHIAYPDEILDVNKLNEFYDKLEINQDGYYLDAILNMTKFGLDYSFNRLRKPVNKTDWITHGRPAVVNAFYSSIENSIQFPAGILQGAFFNNDRPNYMNYGAIGFVIGHEITHGFDDQGRQFDKDGNLIDWWAPETKEAYLKKASCIIHQYGNYTSAEVGLNLNGVNTQGENIADNGGIKQAYLAYNNWAKQHGTEKRLPGLQHLNPQQMFWISAANTWCSKYRPETLKLRIITGQHSPGEFRVRGPLSNRPEFAKDFKCPLGSKMNPVKKCQVW